MNNTKIYTSYFSNYRNFPDNSVPIAITLYAPNKYNGIIYDKLAPSQNILSKFKFDGNNKGFLDAYTEKILKYLNPHKVVADLCEISNNKTVILLCYEKPTDFCHRHIVAKWLRDAGYDVSEFKKEEEI